MTRLIFLVCMTIGGWLGWWVGAHIGLTTAFILSSAGSIGGVYLAWRIHRDYFG